MSSVIFRTIGGRVVPIKVASGTPGAVPFDPSRVGTAVGGAVGRGAGGTARNTGSNGRPRNWISDPDGVGAYPVNPNYGSGAGQGGGLGLDYGRHLGNRAGDPNLYNQIGRDVRYGGTGRAWGAGVVADEALGTVGVDVRIPPRGNANPMTAGDRAFFSGTDIPDAPIPGQAGRQRIPTNARAGSGGWAGTAGAVAGVAAMGADAYIGVRRGESGRRAAVGAAGGFLGGFAGGTIAAPAGVTAGAAAGAALGSVVPGVGTAVGAAAGAVVGGVAAGLAGGAAGGYIGGRAADRADNAINGPNAATMGWGGQQIRRRR